MTHRSTTYDGWKTRSPDDEIDSDPDSLYLVIYEPENGDFVLVSRKLGDNEILDEQAFAEQWASEHDLELDNSPGHIPSCSGDIRVEFRHDPNNGTVIWSGQSFYLKREDY